MNILLIVFILNATLLLLHEIESAYEKEWEILKIPGDISLFLILHIPVIILLFYGLLEIHKGSFTGMVFGIITGFCGLLPFFVHKIVIRLEDRFNHLISNIIIYLNIITGLITLIISICMIKKN